MKVEMKWGRWLGCTAVLVAVGFYRHWDTLSLVCLGVLVFTGAIRLWVAVSASGFERRVAGWRPEARERFRAGLPEVERAKWRERLRAFGVEVGAEPPAPPTGGPATQVGTSGVSEGPPSES